MQISSKDPAALRIAHAGAILTVAGTLYLALGIVFLIVLLRRRSDAKLK